mgnify:CR=1 FL=1
MEIKKAKKIGLFTAISMLIASVIGIGIFLRNQGIFAINDNNSIGILLSWGIGTITALATAYSFAEISTSAKGKAGLGSWAEKLLGKKFGYFVKLNFPLFYLSLLGAVLAFFMGDAFFFLIGQEDVHFGWIGLFSLGFAVFIYIINYCSIKVSGVISIVANVSKFVPIVAIIIISIVFSIINNDAGFFNPETTTPDIVPPPINITGLLAAVPSVLFAFDSFLVVGNLSDDIIRPKKNVPIAVVLGISICAIIYILITIAQILVMNGNALTFFQGIFPELDPSVIKGLSITMNIIITIAVIGVVNTIAAGTIRAHSVIINDKIAFFAPSIDFLSRKAFGKYKNENSTGFISAVFVFLFYWIILMIPSSIVGPNGNDHYLDWISNFPTLFFFLIYGLVILGGFINRFTKKVEVTMIKGFTFASIIAILFILFIFAYSFFYTNIAEPIINPNKLKNSLGLFHNSTISGGIISNQEGAFIFAGFLLWFISLPFINLGFRKLFKMNNKFLNKSTL